MTDRRRPPPRPEKLAAHASTLARLRALGLPGADMQELAASAATVLEQLRERGILLP